MQVEVLMGVDVIERQSGRGKGVELRLDLRRELPPHRAVRDDIETEPRHIRAKPAGAVDQIGQPLRRQCRRTLDQHDMEPDAEARQPPCPLDRIRSRRARDHQDRRRKDAVAVRDLDGLIDL